MSMKCIRIGFGKIAQIHEEHLRKQGVHTIGVVEIDPKRIQAIELAGFKAFNSLAEAIKQQPDFYDICTPVYARADTLGVLCALDPYANILIEKPICDFKDWAQVSQILSAHKGRVAVNENYASSNVTLAVKHELTKRGIEPNRLIIESTKNRVPDFLSGRFIDSQLGALGYECSHLLALVQEMGAGYALEALLESDIDSIENITKHLDNTDSLPMINQNGAFMQYRAKNGCTVDLYSSMTGTLGFACLPYAQPGEKIKPDDVQTRYRILRVDGVDASGIAHQVVGFFEPIHGLERSQSMLFVFKNWVLEHTSAPFEDNTMSQHLLRVKQYFAGGNTNPYDYERALSDVKSLHDWAQTCWHAMDDSNDVLGCEETAIARHEDAKRFSQKA